MRVIATYRARARTEDRERLVAGIGLGIEL